MCVWSAGLVPTGLAVKGVVMVTTTVLPGVMGGEWCAPSE